MVGGFIKYLVFAMQPAQPVFVRDAARAILGELGYQGNAAGYQGWDSEHPQVSRLALCLIIFSY